MSALAVQSQPAEQNPAWPETDSITAALRRRSTLMSVREVKTLLNIHQQTVYEMVWAGKIPAVRIGSRIKFDPKAIAGWMEKGQLG